MIYNVYYISYVLYIIYIIYNVYFISYTFPIYDIILYCSIIHKVTTMHSIMQYNANPNFHSYTDSTFLMVHFSLSSFNNCDFFFI